MGLLGAIRLIVVDLVRWFGLKLRLHFGSRKHQSSADQTLKSSDPAAAAKFHVSNSAKHQQQSSEQENPLNCVSHLSSLQRRSGNGQRYAQHADANQRHHSAAQVTDSRRAAKSANKHRKSNHKANSANSVFHGFLLCLAESASWRKRQVFQKF